MRLPAYFLVLFYSSSSFAQQATTGNTDKTTSSEQINIAYGDHKRHRLDLYRPALAKAAPVMVYVHGGGWKRGDKSRVGEKATFFMSRDWLFVSINYRLLPEGTHPANVDDVAKALAWTHDHAADYGGDPDRLFLMGHSAGAHLASLVATSEAPLRKIGKERAMIKGVIPLDTNTYDIVRLMKSRSGAGYKGVFGEDPEIWRDASPITHVAADQGIPPFMICYSRGMRKAANPERPAQANAFAKALRAAGIDATVVDASDRNHGEINRWFGRADDEKVTKAAEKFLDGLLGVEKTETEKESSTKQASKGSDQTGQGSSFYQDGQGRLRMALQIAREHNDKSLVAEVEKTGKQILRELKAGQFDGQEEKLQVLEEKVGIDPGGWAMAGQPLFYGTAEMQERMKDLRPKLAEAMKSGEATAVEKVTAELHAVLGDQAGVPDGRRAGKDAPPLTMTEVAATRLFLDALASEGRSIRQLSEAKPLPDQMVRLYAKLMNATHTIRPFVKRHSPAKVAELDLLTTGLATILINLQQPSGFFPFPDLRGVNIRFGDMIERGLAAGAVEVRDGWIVTVDPDGGTQFDTGLCGVALLNAAEQHENDKWKQAGLHAADWALAQPCCANFNYNAFSVSLLAHAYRVTGDPKYLDGALEKFRVGVAPGQAPNGRWLDPHNARTVYHVIILRAMANLASVLPAESKAERKNCDQVIVPAVEALLDEFDAMGQTVEALPELLTLAKLYPDNIQLRQAVQDMASSLAVKSTDGTRVKMGAQPHQLAAIPVAISRLDPQAHDFR